MGSESWLKASAQLGFREVDQLGVSLLLELDGPSVRPWRKSHPWTCFPMDLVKDAAFFVMGATWVLAWEKWLQMAVPLPGVSWQMEQIEVTKVIALTKYGKR